MKANNVPGSSARAFYLDKEGGFLGFNMAFVGSKYISNPNVAYNVGSTQYHVVKNGQWDGCINFDKEQELFGWHWWGRNDDACIPVCLVKNIY